MRAQGWILLQKSKCLGGSTIPANLARLHPHRLCFEFPEQIPLPFLLINDCRPDFSCGEQVNIHESAT